MFYANKADALNALGSGSTFGADDLAEKLTYQSGADTPANTSSIPTFIGEYYLDTANNVWYKATGTSAASDFKALNS